jgi:hypothetical protein
MSQVCVEFNPAVTLEPIQIILTNKDLVGPSRILYKKTGVARSNPGWS